MDKILQLLRGCTGFDESELGKLRKKTLYFGTEGSEAQVDMRSQLTSHLYACVPTYLTGFQITNQTVPGLLESPSKITSCFLEECLYAILDTSRIIDGEFSLSASFRDIDDHQLTGSFVIAKYSVAVTLGVQGKVNPSFTPREPLVYKYSSPETNPSNILKIDPFTSDAGPVTYYTISLSNSGIVAPPNLVSFDP